MAYWHGSFDEIEIGTRLAARADGYVADATGALEHLFEGHRPAGCISRAKAVFLVEDPDEIDAAGGYTDFVYEVEPEGPTSRHDLAWYSDAQAAIEERDDERADACARAYWAGVPYPDASCSLFETLAHSARVVAAEPDACPSP